MTKKEKQNKKSTPVRGNNKRRIVDYLIQLSVVVIGILITFQGSAWIERFTERKDRNYILSMVRDELVKNRDKLIMQKDVLTHEEAGSAAIKPYLNDPKLIPRDSLSKYSWVLTRIKTYGFTSNSFDVLKSSSQIQTIRNKELLRRLFEIYEDIETAHNGVINFYSQKQNGMSGYLEELDSDTYDAAFTSEDPSEFIIHILGNRSIRNYIIATANGNNHYLIPEIERLEDEIAATVAILDNEVNGRRKRKKADD